MQLLRASQAPGRSAGAIEGCRLVWITDVLPDGPFEPDETLIPRIFDAQDRLAALPSDAALLATLRGHLRQGDA